MKRRIKKELSIGLLLLGIALTLKQFVPAPEFVFGVLMGVSISFEFVGALPDKAYNSLKQWKKTI